MPSASENTLKNLVPIKTETDTPIRLGKVTPNVGEDYSNYGLNDFLSMFKEFQVSLQPEKTYYVNLFNIYLKIAKSTFPAHRYFEQTPMVWGLYIAHNLAIAFNNAKNVNNVANLNSSIQTVSTKGNIGGEKGEFRSSINEYYNSYAQTQYGILLYPLVKSVETLNMIGVY